MRKILILPISVGGGHFKVAQALKDAFLKKSTDFEIDIEDALNHVAWPLRFLYRNVYFFYISHFPFSLHYRRAYRKSKRDTAYVRAWHWFFISCFLFLSKGLRRYILDFKPDLIIPVYPLPLELISIWKKRSEIKCPLVSITTDLVPHRLWIFPNVDQYYVGTEEIKELFLEYAISRDKIKVTGIPLYPKFYKELDKDEILNNLGLSRDKKTVLVLCRRLRFKDLRKVLLDLRDLNVQAIIITERDKKLQRNLKREKKKFAFPIVIFEYTKIMAELMTVADVLISKPGGIILAEAICKKLPMVLINPIPGQEEDNLEFLLTKKAALYTRNSQEIVDCTKRLLTSEEIRYKIRANLEKLAKPKAADVIAGDIIDKFLK